MRVEVDADMAGFDSFEGGARKRLAAVTQRAQLLMHKRVPMSSGPSSGTLRGSTGGSDYGSGRIVYDTPYANYQYNLATSNRTTPGTSDHWDDEVREGAGKADLDAFAAELIRRDLG